MAVSNKKVMYIAVAFLLAIALLTTLFRVSMRNEGGLPAGDTTWLLEIAHKVTMAGEGATISIPSPWDTRHARVYAKTLSHPGLRLRSTKSDRKDRDIVLVSEGAGSSTIKSDYYFHISSVPLNEPRKSGPSEQDLVTWLSASDGVSVGTPATEKIVGGFDRNSSQSECLFEFLFNHVNDHVRVDSKAGHNSEPALSRKRASALGKTNALIALLRTAHLPARLVTGINLQASPGSQPIYWSEVYVDDKWVALDPVGGYLKDLPPHYIPFRTGNRQWLVMEDARLMRTDWKITSIPAYGGLLSTESKKLVDILDLNRLAPSSRSMLAVLLLLPLGALATQIVRQFAGVRTYGTFTPTLLALAGTRVDLQTATIVFSLVILIGVALRATIPSFELGRAARLAIVFTLVAMSMALVTSGLSFVSSNVDGTVVLLPTVILTMLVDRIYTVYDESGLHTVLVRLFWTVLSAFICLYILLQKHWGVWLVTYPEMHAITLATIILIGHYQGPTLKRVPALRVLFEKDKKSSRRATDSAG